MDKKSVDEWRRGQAAAAKKITEERTVNILGLTPERSQRIFLSLRSQPRRRLSPREPSFLLMEMRKVLGRRMSGTSPSR